MSDPQYTSEVVFAYLATFAILGALVWASWRSSKRAAERLQKVEAESKRNG